MGTVRVDGGEGKDVWAVAGEGEEVWAVWEVWTDGEEAVVGA